MKIPRPLGLRPGRPASKTTLHSRSLEEEERHIFNTFFDGEMFFMSTKIV